MGLVKLVIDSKMPELLADIVIDCVPTILLCLSIVMLIGASFIPAYIYFWVFYR